MAFEAKQKSCRLHAYVALGPNKSYTLGDLGCFIMGILTISCTGEWINMESMHSSCEGMGPIKYRQHRCQAFRESISMPSLRSLHRPD